MKIFADFEYCHDSEKPSKRSYVDLIQLGFVICDDNYNILNQIGVDVRPAHLPLTDYIENLTGLTTEVLKKAKPLNKVLKDIEDYILQADIIYVFGNYDEVALNRNKNYVSSNNKHLINVMTSKMCEISVRGSNSSLSLEECCEVAGIKSNNKHSALCDAYNLYQVYKYLSSVEELPPEVACFLVYKSSFKTLNGLCKLVSKEKLLKLVDTLYNDKGRLGYKDFINLTG